MTAPGHRPGSAAYRRITWGLFAAGLANFAMIYCTQPLLPLLAEHFRVSPGQSTLSVSATTLALGGALVFLGPVSDATGRVRIMRLSLIGSVLLTAACVVAPSWGVMILLRAVLGLFVAGLPAVAVSYLREEVALEAAGRATGLYIGGTALGGMIGRLVSGLAADLGGWQWAVATTAALGAACTAVVVLLLPPSARFDAVPLRPAALWANAVAALRDPGLLCLYGIGFASMGAFVATFNAMGFRLAAAPYRLSTGMAGLVFLSYALGSVASAQAGRLADRHGARAVVPGTVLLALVGLLTTLGMALPVLVLGLAVLTTGFFACHGVVSGWVAARASALGTGTAQAGSLYLLGYYLGASLVGGLGGVAWGAYGWPGDVLLAAVLLTAALLLSWVLRRIPSLHEPAGPDPGVAAV